MDPGCEFHALVPYVGVINSMAQGYCASSIAPAETPEGGVYAHHLRTAGDPQVLAALL